MLDYDLKLDQIDSQAKKDLLDMYLQKQKELGKRQREYKKILSLRHKTRESVIIDTSYVNGIERLKLERNDLRAQLWVSNGKTHTQENTNLLNTIKCHVSCQEYLANDIQKLKTVIGNMEREISRVDKEIYELNRKTVPDSQHQAHVADVRKKMGILENQLEVGIRRECSFIALNAILRKDIKKILHNRALFNETYTKLMQKLNSDKKYLIDLMEYAFGTFENCIEVHEKINSAIKKKSKENDVRKVEMQGIIRSMAATQDIDEFLSTKGKIRFLGELDSKEYWRRENFRHKHEKKIHLYKTITARLLDFTNCHSLLEVSDRFQQQESVYYSYFSYTNEMGYHITLLNNSVNRLYNGLEDLKTSNRSRLQGQMERLAALQTRLEQKQQRNRQWTEAKELNERRINDLLSNMDLIFAMCHTSPAPLLPLLGDHSRIEIGNVRRFTNLLENRVLNIVANVYCLERTDFTKNPDQYTVRHIEKIMDYLTPLKDIVLTQQCPECAEGEAFNMDDAAEGGVNVHSIEESKKKLYEKVNQPEMQYRLHSISQCRLPRSRILAAKRNM